MPAKAEVDQMPRTLTLDSDPARMPVRASLPEPAAWSPSVLWARPGDGQAVRVPRKPARRFCDGIAGDAADERRVAQQVVQPQPKQLDVGQHLRDARVGF